ncbi:MAG TPA: RagB/SusD family nutrient uptake outer membrane protein [Longimicrobiales bacterium]|nr:RagB/SusD family nutrient uptake outer membrane protein [Longimicrobiales bacterium]
MRDKRNNAKTGPGARRRATAVLAMGVLLVSAGGCESLLDVEIPGSVQASDLDNPALAPTLYFSALGSFECAYTNYVATVAVLTEEYIVSSAWLNDNIWGWRGPETKQAAGNCSNNRDASGFGAYTPLQQARFLAEDIIDRLNNFEDAEVPNRAKMLASLQAYTGYTYTLLGEGFCEMSIDEGPLMQPAQVLAIAEKYFTDGIAAATAAGDENIRLLALLGRARVRLDLGKDAEAATDAAGIPAGWSFDATYSTIQGSRENRIYNITIRNSYLSVAPEYRGLQVAGEPDPRVRVEDTGVKGHDGETPQWIQLKYPSADAPIRMASWEEAQLIIAEAKGGADAVNAINQLRAAQGIAPLENPNLSNMLPTVLEERRRQLFTEGHRLNDMLRHSIPFPTGTNHKGQTYGPTTCIWLPDQERNNNPNL